MDSIKKRKAKEIALIAKLQRYESETNGESNLPLNLKYTKLLEKYRRRSLAQDTIPETHNNQNVKRFIRRDDGGKVGFLPSLAAPSNTVFKLSSSSLHGITSPKLLVTFPITKDEVYKKYTYLLPKKSSRFLPMMNETAMEKPQH
ncbi:hypothetical protein CHS0354_007565 [Potamilus streckersoni]|uniref:Uncharacterized protein n=1 Tax=Potamilus streckersoni TaxID=2493646 RepID=A0AAE0T4Q7_9BIVA|nr:hypothetical protein CHS0354_007565 [Potamilus streckersoni]